MSSNEKPFFMVYQAKPGDKIIITLQTNKDWRDDHRYYGLILGSLIRQIATTFEVDPEDVLEVAAWEFSHPLKEVNVDG